MKVKGIAWDFDVPVVRYGTTIYVKRGAFRESIKASKSEPIRLMWSHDEMQLPVGMVTSMVETENWLEFEGEILDTQAGRDLVTAMRSRAVRNPSIAFSRDQAEYKVDEKTDTMTYSRVPLREISAVNFPAHPAARMWLVDEPVTQPSPPAAGEQKE